jgi:protein-S-isoprenylcysteine O-methyltransferase Ste14
MPTMTTSNNILNASDFSDKGLKIRIGQKLFKARNYISAPIFIFLCVAFFWEYENDLIVWALGPAVVCLGEALRLWSMRHIGRSARTRKDKARRLVATGPYAFTRNPLYVGNHMILLGFCVMSEMLWFIPIALGICFTFYSFIILYEEELLKTRFGDEYLNYMAETRRWIPLPKMRELIQPAWREAFRRERSTIYGIIIGIIAFGLKELVSHIIWGG